VASITAPVVTELRQIVGEPNVWTDDDRIGEQSRDIGPWRTRGAAIVLPQSTQEVAGVLAIATRERLPVWTFSGGWNWGYGAAMGLHDGALILLLRRMNRIVEVNEELAYAVVEPGVTQAQLREYLAAHHPGLWSDSTDSTPNGSIIGNALEHGVGYTPMCDHFGALCGLEAVLADGTIVHTGGSSPDASTRYTHRWGTGPSLDGLFGQSNLGVVTKAGIWLMPKPETHTLFLVEMDDAETLGSVFDAVRTLSLDGLLRANVHAVNDVLFSAVLGPYPHELLDPNARFLNEAGRAELRERYKIAPFTMTGGLYGTKAQVAVQRRALEKRLPDAARLRFVGSRLARIVRPLAAGWRRASSGGIVDRALRSLTGASAPKLQATTRVLDLLQGIPGELILGFAYFKTADRPDRDLDPARDGAGMIWSPCVLPMRGSDARTVMELARQLYEEHGFDYSNSFISVNARTMMSLMQIWFRPDDADETRRALGLQRALFEACQDAGYPQYRTGHSLHGALFDGAPGYLHLAGAVKRALDPAGILAPGRYGLGTPRAAGGPDRSSTDQP